MLFSPGLGHGRTTAAGEPPHPPVATTAQGSDVRHTDHVPSAAVVFVDESGEPDAWAPQVQAVTQAGFCAVLLTRVPAESERQHLSDDAQVLADDLADLLRRLDHDTTTVVGRDHAVAGVVRLLANDPEAKVDHAVLVGLVLPAVTADGVDDADSADLVTELRRVHIPVFVARSTDEPLSVDEFAADLHAGLPDRWMVRTYRQPSHALTHPGHGAFMDDLLDFLGDPRPVPPPNVDPSASATTSNERDS